MLLLNSCDFNLDPKLLINMLTFIVFFQIYFVYDRMIIRVIVLFQVIISSMAYKMPSFIFSHQYTTCFGVAAGAFCIALLCRLCFRLFHDMIVCTLQIFYFSFNCY